ncbi:MAG: hypothetical protein JST93_18440 [Acidobacteria bacterium]|nr:hypothetical protein [Acidobacteriota bacterium]
MRLPKRPHAAEVVHSNTPQLESGKNCHPLRTTKSGNNFRIFFSTYSRLAFVSNRYRAAPPIEIWALTAIIAASLGAVRLPLPIAGLP